MRILSESTYDAIKESEYSRGKEDGKKIGWDRGYAEGERNAKVAAFSNKVTEKLNKFKEAKVIIESITLSTKVRPTRWDSSVQIPQYEIKFRSKSGGTTSQILVAFDSPDFSMADVRRKITEEFCGGCK